MRGKIWRKALAASLALLIVTGSVPIKPISNVFESMVVTAEAVEEVTKTYSLSTYVRADDGLSFSMIDPDDNTSKTVFTADGDALTNGIRDIGSTKEVFSKLSVDSPKARFLVLPNVNGKVTKIEFTKACRAAGKVVTGNTLEQCSFFMSIDGMKYNGTDDALTGESHLDEKGNETESVNFTFISTDPEGIEGNLSLWLGKKSMFRMLSGCEIIIHYIPAAEPAHQHNFTYSMNGNTLTATCGHSDGRSCSLADSNHQISVSLEAEDAYYQFGYVYPATLLNNSLFASETGATIGNITYRNNTTGVDLGTQKPTGSGENPTGAGDYTASVTINVGGTTYTLTKDYSLSNLFTINNSYPQFSIGTEKYSVTNRAAENETVTLTFTPQYGETLNSLSVKGETTNYSLENGINKVDDTHYTFSMPAEEVSISEATFGIDENDFVQDGDTYTIKNANGWNYFCLLTNYDTTLDGFNGKTVKLDKDIEVSTMEGMSGHPFKGTFDGQNHTLTFNLTASEGYSAPFHYTDGATISNLHVEGTITGGTYESLGGLVGRATGNITIENCHVSTQISTTYSAYDGSAWHGGVIADWNGTNATCTVTGCVYDGLIYNPNEAGVTGSCRGFIGWYYGNNISITFTDCLFAPAAYGTGKYELGDNCYTFIYLPNSDANYNMTNCYYTTALGNRQGRPAATATTAPANLGKATTDHGLVKGYENGFLYNGNYYTPKYGDAIVEYSFNDWNESASVTFNGEGNNLMRVNIDEEVSNVKSVTYNRKFTEGKAAIVILPFAYTCNGSEGGTFYTFAGVNGNQPIMEDSNKLTTLTANTPYLFMPSGTTLSFPNIANMTNGYVTLQPTAGEHNITSDAWTLTGTYEYQSFITDDSNIMVLNNDGELVAVTNATKVSPTSGYFVRDSSVFAITVNSGEGGTITADPLYAKENDKVTLTVTPNAGYVLKSLTVKDSSNTPITVTNNQFTMPASDVTVTAEFKALSASEVTITKQPTDLDLEKGASSGNILTVEAEEISGHTLSYQWYKNTKNSTEGGSEISGATAASYAVPTDSEGTGYYYCVVTATRTDNGETATATSEIAAVTVADYSTVIWKNGDTLLEKDDHVRNGTTPSYDSETPTKTADAQYTYTFSGWSDGTNTYAPNALPTVSGDVTYTAQFSKTVNKYTITWKDGDGNTLKTEQVAYGTVPSYSGATPTKTATAQYSYTFTGWNTTPVAVTGNATYTAQFSEATREYAVTWKDGDGNTLKTDQVAYGETPAYTGDTPTKTATAQYTYTFNETWDTAISAVTGDVTYTAQFDRTVNKYTVTWKNENGTALETDENVEYGTMPEYNGTAPTKASTSDYTYSFSGWSPSVSAVTGDVTYTATFTAHSTYVPPTYYTITYKVDGKVYQTASSTSGSKITLIDEPTKEGYTFSGWQTSYTTMPASDIEITGTFAINQYAVTYMVDGVQYGESLTVDHGTKLTAPEAPTKNGAIFLGWTADGVNAYDFETPVTAETTLTAMWLDASGFITFSEGYAVTDDTYNGTDRDYVGFRFDVNMDNSNYTVLQHGILYGMNVAAFGEGKADANLRFTDEEATALMAKVREFAAQNTDTETTDWIEVYIGDRRDGVVYARGFIIVTDGTNKYLIYSDVQQGSYNSFSE